MNPPAYDVQSYGPDPEQLIFLLPPFPGTGVRGVVILVHGGYWRARLDASLMDALALDLSVAGWAVANVEYRRGGNGGGWPGTLQDVRTAVAAVETSGWTEGYAGPRILMGHSVGGQLALLAGDLVDGVVALAPVTDVVRTHVEGLGEGAAQEFFGATPQERPEVYHEASPLAVLPPSAPVLVVHGENDDRVPVAHSRDYFRAALLADGPVSLQVFPALGHLEAIDPKAVHWAGVLAWMEAVGTRALRDSSNASA
ncbi:alpha/beta hydrolase family protein [Paeniglutamicibacter sp. NPDC091659]|uniref:alpha/beta hydrolase family protein n=1 Tax=Paeniglutamicibacter sp. NPDC091659 TaxID=3364389 RepID=UPI003813EA01